MSTNTTTFTAGQYKYTAIFEPDEEGGYVVTVPALPGCVTYGKTLAEAEAMAAEAILGFVETLGELGEEIPVEHGEPTVRQICVRLAAV